MKDIYFSAFHQVVQDTQKANGYELPQNLEAYLVMLLSQFVDRPNFTPEESFAEAYLKLSRYRSMDAKELGDICLFVTGVFPTFGNRKGLSITYYRGIGKSSYEIASTMMNRELFVDLSNHFDFLSDFINLTVNDKKIKPLINF